MKMISLLLMMYMRMMGHQVQTWEQTIPPMPRARDSPGVLSLPSMLIVAGGDGGILAYTAAVKIFK